MHLFRTKLLKSLLIIFLTLSGFEVFARDTGAVTGLPIPRFVVLKSAEVNLRKGPNPKYPIVWTYKRKGYPMELIGEYENWRRLRDQDGAEGWVHENLITGVRNVMIKSNFYKTHNPLYKNKNSELVLFRYPDETSYPMVRAQIGAIAKLKKCQREWCKVKIDSYTAWVQKINLWGVYPDEIID